MILDGVDSLSNNIILEVEQLKTGNKSLMKALIRTVRPILPNVTEFMARRLSSSVMSVSARMYSSTEMWNASLSFRLTGT